MAIAADLDQLRADPTAALLHRHDQHQHHENDRQRLVIVEQIEGHLQIHPNPARAHKAQSR